MKKYFALWVVLLSLSACHPVQNVQTNNLLKIEYGSGGGFSGVVMSNLLSADHTVTPYNQQPHTISPAAFDSIVSLSGQIQTSYQHPGNTYSFVNIYRQTDTVYCAWSLGDKKVSREIILLYNTLSRL